MWRESLPVDRLRALYEFASAGHAARDEELLTLAAKKIAACLEFDVSAHPRQNGPSEEGGSHLGQGGALPPSRVSISRASSRCLRQRVSLLADKREEGVRRIRGRNAMIRPCVPLLSGDSVLGAIYVDSKSSAMTTARRTSST